MGGCCTRIHTCACWHFIRSGPWAPWGRQAKYVYLYVDVYVVDPWCQLASGSCSPLHQGGVLLHTYSRMHVLTFSVACVRPGDGR